MTQVASSVRGVPGRGFNMSGPAQDLNCEAQLAALHEDIAHFIELYRHCRRREADLEGQCIDLTNERNELRKTNASLVDQISVLDDELQSLRVRVINAEAAHNDLRRVYASRSWRYTRLFRRENS